MGVLLDFKFFDEDGNPVKSGQLTLPEWLDWKSIEEKEVWFRHMGGMPGNAHQCLIISQGQSKLLSTLDGHKEPVDLLEYRRRLDGSEQVVEERCRELGIDRTRKPRNQ